MGLLSESKRRRKISKDPNNTKWSRDTSTFGQKILRSQGWEPGQFLGAKDARHSGLLTAANAPGIRVSLKDDVKGLGFDKAKEDQVTGLDVFSDLLSRLNGKSEGDIEGAKQARLVMKTNLYVERKWGATRFVRGGLLVGDTVKAGMVSEEASAAPAAGKNERKSKKRKLDHDEHQDVATDSKGEKKRRKEERRARRASAIATPDSAHEANPGSDAKAKKKQKKKERMTKKPIEDSGDGVDAEQDQTEPVDETPPRKVRKSKQQGQEAAASAVDEDTKAEKRPKKSKKEKKSRSKAGEPQETLSTKQADGFGSATASGVSTPAEPDAGTGTPKGGRNLVRSRFIAAKRQALLDAKALDQIFMIKT